MIKKIDPQLFKTVYALGEDKTACIDCLIYTNNLTKLEQYFKSHEIEFGLKSLFCFPFIKAVAVNLSASKLLQITSLNIVDYVSSVVNVQAMMDVSREILRLEQIHNLGITGKGVTICYIDTGINPHIDFVIGKNRILYFKNFINDNQNLHDDNGHGTFVCGVGSGNGRASGGKYCGIAPCSNIVSLKALSKDGESGAITILSAMQWVYEHHKEFNIKVVCMSFGSEPMAIGDPIAKGAEMLVDEGIVVVAASGNSGPEHQTVKSPGISPKIITVGGLDDSRGDGGWNYKNFKVAKFSSRGPAFKRYKPDVVAPAVNITSCSINSKLYCKMSGTSVATPMVAGLCALLIQKYPNAKPSQIKQKLMSSCISFGNGRNEEGCGLVDAIKFILY